MLSPDIADLNLCICWPTQCARVTILPFFVEVRWPDAVFKASKAPHLVTSNVIPLVLLRSVESMQEHVYV